MSSDTSSTAGEIEAVVTSHITQGSAGLALVMTGAVVIVAYLVNRFAPREKKKVRRTVILLFLYLVTFAAALGLGAAGITSATELSVTVLKVSELLAVFTGIHLCGIIIFDLGLRGLRTELPTIISDVAIGLAYVIAAMRSMGVDPSSILATSAVLTAVLALSLQATLGNVLGGVALQLDNSIKPGDWIQLENGKQGKVRAIRWRHTVVETRDWDTVIVPNASLLSANIVILGKREAEPLQHRMWVYFNVDFRYGPTEVIRVVNAALQMAPLEGVAAEPKAHCICYDFAREGRDSFTYYAVRYWLTDLARDDPASSLVRTRIYAALKRAGIPLAVPAAQIFVEQDDVARRERKMDRELQKRLEALSDIAFLKPLHKDELSRVADKLVFAPFVAGETITLEGTVAHWLYIITRGVAEICVTRGGENTVVAEIQAPGFFGEMGLMTGEPRQATVIAATDVDCYRLDKEAFHQIMMERKEIASEISELLAQRDVELSAAREHLDAAAKDSRMAQEKTRILATIQGFFGLTEE